MRISDWSSDVCSSDLLGGIAGKVDALCFERMREHEGAEEGDVGKVWPLLPALAPREQRRIGRRNRVPQLLDIVDRHVERLRERLLRSEEHTSELQSLMRISYAVFCLKKKNKKK